MHVAAGVAEHVQQTHGVDRAAGACDTKDDGMIHGSERLELRLD